MHNDLLELPQRLIAFARIGLRPAPADIWVAIHNLDQARASLWSNGQSTVALESARSALVTLQSGHLPSRGACIAAVSALGAVMAVGVSMEDA